MSAEPQDFAAWLNAHVFTPSELEAYQLCPFRFYAQAYLKLRPEVRGEVELTPPEIGQCVHRVLEGLLSRGPQTGEQARILVDREIEALLPSRPHLSKVLLEFQKQKILRTLENFLEDLNGGRSRGGLKPRFFEWSFGDPRDPKGAPPLAIPDGRGGTIRLRGRVDRIDVDEEKKRFLVVDYKTGSTKISGNQIRCGEALQLPLYVLAVQDLLLPGYEAVGGVYHQLSDMTQKDGILHAERLPAFLDLHPRSTSLVPAGLWESTFETIQDCVRDIVDKIRGGDFKSHEEPCETYCPYQDICLLRSRRETP